MPAYYVNRNPQPTPRHEHEVHDAGAHCPAPPAEPNREDLGWHPNCRSALAAAEALGYRPADGCAYCVPECHRPS